MKVDFSDRIRLLRESRNMTQSELGRKINVTKAVISSYETGLHYPRHDALVKMAEFFGVSMDYMYGMTDKASTQFANKNLDLSGLSGEQELLLELVIQEFRKANRR